MNEEKPIKMDAQLALGRAENIKEWINRFAETANRDDYQKLMEKYADLGFPVGRLFFCCLEKALTP